MDNQNSKFNSYTVREAHNVIENYLRNREMSDMKNYFQLKEKYERLKILTVSLMVTNLIATLISLIV